MSLVRLLKGDLDDRVERGTADGAWHWCRRVDDAYEDWGNGSILRRLQTDDTVLHYFEEMPLSIPGIARAFTSSSSAVARSRWAPITSAAGA
jgi:hypothetical protein